MKMSRDIVVKKNAEEDADSFFEFLNNLTEEQKSEITEFNKKIQETIPKHVMEEITEEAIKKFKPKKGMWLEIQY